MDLENWFARRSEDQYAQPVEGLEELKPELQAALLTALEPGEPIRYMINAPYQGRLKQRKDLKRSFRFRLPWQLSPNWLLALTPSRLLLVGFSEGGNPAQVTSIRLADILHLQSGAVLLFSWFEITWVENHEVCRQEIYFNSVCERFFDRLSLLIRGDLTVQPQPIQPVDRFNRAALDPLPYKFKNLIPMRLLLPGEQIVRVAFRPASYSRALGLFRRTVWPQLALVLTDRHVLIVEEELNNPAGSYSLISTFLPLSRVCDSALERGTKQLALTLRLELDRVEKGVVILFPLEAEAELQILTQDLR